MTYTTGQPGRFNYGTGGRGPLTRRGTSPLTQAPAPGGRYGRWGDAPGGGSGGVKPRPGAAPEGQLYRGGSPGDWRNGGAPFAPPTGVHDRWGNAPGGGSGGVKPRPGAAPEGQLYRGGSPGDWRNGGAPFAPPTGVHDRWGNAPGGRTAGGVAGVGSGAGNVFTAPNAPVAPGPQNPAASSGRSGGTIVNGIRPGRQTPDQIAQRDERYRAVQAQFEDALARQRAARPVLDTEFDALMRKLFRNQRKGTRSDLRQLTAGRLATSPMFAGKAAQARRDEADEGRQTAARSYAQSVNALDAKVRGARTERDRVMAELAAQAARERAADAAKLTPVVY